MDLDLRSFLEDIPGLPLLATEIDPGIDVEAQGDDIAPASLGRVFFDAVERHRLRSCALRFASRREKKFACFCVVEVDSEEGGREDGLQDCF